ncbi:hypothetical protein SBOR_8222 [Sclerotinia borealis F-4128]|uniref:Uncharacterized protein n=1 Tax=Sclerotinia borealis (strain F-4128) TaxID=1432307 RepID=W9C6Q4_SCLBF|nr:hypothetical protein SBOR_8222 [Sclerotinia borealis F-4128]
MFVKWGPSKNLSRLIEPESITHGQHYLLIAAYFDETWTQKVLTNERIGHFAKKYMFNPRFEPIIRDRIPSKYDFRTDWLLKEFANEQSSFAIAPFEAEPVRHVHAATTNADVVRKKPERRMSSAYIPITSQLFVELKRSLLRKIEKEFPPSKIVGQKVEGWLHTWLNMPEKPSKLFSFQPKGPSDLVLDGLGEIRIAMERLGPARINGLKLMHFRLLPGTQEHKVTFVRYYPFKDCKDDYSIHPIFEEVP